MAQPRVMTDEDPEGNAHHDRQRNGGEGELDVLAQQIKDLLAHAVQLYGKTDQSVHAPASLRSVCISSVRASSV